MKQSIAHIALVVADYDEAIAFYTERLSFELIADEPQTETKRWVLVAPKDSECQILLAKAVGEEQKSRIGNQTGGRVFLFLRTDNFQRDYKDYLSKGVKFVREPKTNRRLRHSCRFCGFIRQSMGFSRVFKTII